MKTLTFILLVIISSCYAIGQVLPSKQAYSLDVKQIHSGHSLTDPLFGQPWPGQYVNLITHLRGVWAGDDIGKATIPGSPMFWRWAHENTLNPSARFDIDDWELLVITEGIPIPDDGGNPPLITPAYEHLSLYVNNAWNNGNHGNGAATLLWATWTNLNGIEGPWRPTLDAYELLWEEMMDYANAHRPSGSTPVYIIPGHRMVARLYDDIQNNLVPGISDINEFFSDNIHTNSLGDYAIAMIHYACIYTSNLVFLSEVAEIQKGKTITEAKAIKGNIPVIAGGQSPAYFHNVSNRDGNIITVSASGAYAGFINYFEEPIFASDCNTIKSKDEKILSTNLIFHFLKSIQKEVYKLQRGQAQPHVYADDLSKVKIPLPPLDIQKKIVSEIEALVKQEQKAVENIEKLRTEIETNFKTIKGKLKRLDEVCELKAGNLVKADKINKEFSLNLYPCYGGNGLRGYTETFTNEGQFSLVGRQGALCGNVHLVSGKFHATEHALVAYPKDGVDAIWLHYQLLFMNLNQYATGTAQPGLSVMNINPIEIPAPTISDQKKIVSAIVKIEAKIIELRKQISDIPKQKEKILKSYLV